MTKFQITNTTKRPTWKFSHVGLLVIYIGFEKFIIYTKITDDKKELVFVIVCILCVENFFNDTLRSF